MNSYLIPRLSPNQASARLEQIEKALGEGRKAHSLIDLDPHESVPNPTGGQPVTPEQLGRWRDKVRSLVDPAPRHKNEHGIQLGRALDDVFNPLPSDASHDGVWSFLSLYVFPDLVLERWPGESGSMLGGVSLPRDRWIGAQDGRDRNYIKLSWRRWKILGPVMEHAAPSIGEDEFGALLERTAVARNTGLVRAAAERIVAHQGAGLGRMEFSRALMKRICYQTGARCLDILTDIEIIALIEEQAVDVLSEVAPREGPPVTGFADLALPVQR